MPPRAGLPRSATPSSSWAFSPSHPRLHTDQRGARDNAARAMPNATWARDEQTPGKAHGLLALEGHWSGKTADGISHGRKSPARSSPTALVAADDTFLPGNESPGS